MQRLFSLEGKTAVVTGSARGLGQGMAVGLAEAGADIIGISFSEQQETKKLVESLGRRFFDIEKDLSIQRDIQGIVEEAINKTGSVDILVNNAGTIKRAEAEHFSDEDWDSVINLNLNSVFRLSRGFGQHMITRGSGKIINIASMLSFQGGLRVPSYTASKHAVAGITKSLANEWAAKGIQVNAIAPGYFATDNTAQIRSDESRNAFITSRIPKAEWGTPADLQGPVVFLASEASNYMTGHIMAVDGGWLSS